MGEGRGEGKIGFETGSKRFMLFPVSAQKQAELERKMRELGVQEQDVVEHFVRSGGKGGQNVNKTATCVYLKHLPTGIEVKMQQERSQAMNRFLARRLMLEKIEEKILGEKSARRQEIERIRRQKRRRSRKSKLKMLEDKRRQGEKKQFRTRVQVEE